MRTTRVPSPSSLRKATFSTRGEVRMASQLKSRIFAGSSPQRRTTKCRWTTASLRVTRSSHAPPIRRYTPKRFEAYRLRKRFTYRTIDIWRVEDGKFAEHCDITDAEEVLRQLRSQ